MNSVIASLNQWSENILAFFWPMLWQSSLLVLVLFGLDLALRRKLRAAVRYGLWLVLLVKLILPPSTAFPSGIGWWLRPRAVTNDIAAAQPGNFTVKYGPETLPPAPQTSPRSTVTLPSANFSPSLLVLGGCLTVSLALLTWMLIRWRQVATQVRKSAPAPGWLHALLDEIRPAAGVSGKVRLRVMDNAMSPAVCGLFRPTVLIPRTLIEGLSPEQLRSILLHELTHLRRGDVWVNCCQTLLQIAYWWHPLLWVANARIRRVREEAVDDAVMLGLGTDTSVYAPTLLQVARLALQRPMSTLGLVGILESPGFLLRRIERLIDFQPPRKAGLSVVSVLCVLIFGAIAVPMGAAPEKSLPRTEAATTEGVLWPDPRFSGYSKVTLEPRFLVGDQDSLRAQFPSLPDGVFPLIVPANEISSLETKLQLAHVQPHTWAEPLSFEKFSGGTFRWLIGGNTNNGVNYSTREIGGRMILTGANATFLATPPEWTPLEFVIVPWLAEGGTRCQLQLGLAAYPGQAKHAELFIPRGGAVVWAVLAGPASRKCQVVVLRERPVETETEDSTQSPKALDQQMSTLLQDARLLYEMGNLKEAEVKLLRVLQEAPGNKAAAYYLNLIRETNYGRASKAAKRVVRPENPDAPSPATNSLYTRIFKVDPNTFSLNLLRSTGFAANTNTEVLPLKEFFASVGVDLAPPKTVYYKDREGVFLVRGSLADLDIIEHAIQELNTAALPQAVDVLRKRVDKFGVAEPLNKSPVQLNLKTKFVELPVRLSKLFWKEMTNSPTGLAVLTDPQARVALKALESLEGVNVDNEASVTTLSGRQTQVQWVDLKTVVTSTNGTGTDVPRGPLSLVTNQVSIGPTVDIYPVVGSDGSTIQITVSASTTEFLGYDDPGQFVPQVDVGVMMMPLTAPLPLPHFRVLQMPTRSAILWDGQTLVLGRSDQIDTNQIPVFGGDRPLVGRLFRSEPQDKDFIIFLTPTIIDPAGNRVHAADENPVPNPKSNGGVLTVPKVLHPTIPLKPVGRWLHPYFNTSSTVQCVS